MSQVARVFVVLNLLLAAGFLFAAATFLAANNDWKGKYETSEKDREADNARNLAEITRQSDENKRLASQNSAVEELRANLQGQVDALTQQVGAAESDKKAKDSQISDLTRTGNDMANTVSNLRNDKNNLNARVETVSTENRAKTAEAADAIKARDEAHAEIVNLNNQIAENEKTIAGQTETIAQKELVIAYAVNKGLDISGIELAPPLSGAVTNADNGMKLVQINLGSSNGVKRGIVMDIVRGSQYIGRMRVDQVFTSSSAGLLTLVSSGQQVMSGDRVTNTLN